MATHKITNEATLELLANELIDHFPEREFRRLNNIKRREKRSEESWDERYEKGKRIRETRAKERDRERKFSSRWRQNDET